MEQLDTYEEISPAGVEGFPAGVSNLTIAYSVVCGYYYVGALSGYGTRAYFDNCVVGDVIGDVLTGDRTHLAVLEHSLEVVVCTADGKRFPNVKACLGAICRAYVPFSRKRALISVVVEHLGKGLATAEIFNSVVFRELMLRPTVVKGRGCMLKLPAHLIDHAL